jgi:hypothetical protein
MGDRGCEKCEELLQDFLDRTLTNEEWATAESAPPRTGRGVSTGASETRS